MIEREAKYVSNINKEQRLKSPHLEKNNSYLKVSSSFHLTTKTLNKNVFLEQT